MRRAVVVALTSVAVVAGSMALAPPALARTAPVTTRRVLIVSYPSATWERVRATRPPVLLALLRKGAVGSMSLRTIGSSTSPGEGYVTIGAGNRAGVDDGVAGLALSPAAPFEGGRADQVFGRRCGCSPDGSAALQVAMPQVTKRNEGFLYGAEVGAMAKALRAGGHRTAVVANADQQLGATTDGVHREAALAVVDEVGRVPYGSVDPDLLRTDPTAPFGVRMDPVATADAVQHAWRGADVVLLEMSDLARAEAYTGVASEAAALGARASAMRRADALLARVLRDVDLRRDLVVVLGPNGPRGPAQLAIAGVVGRGVRPGLLRSATTRRPGFVTLPDVAPTVLAAYGIPAPESMAGTPFTSAGGRPPDDATLAALQHDSVVAQFRDRATGPVSSTFVVFQVLTYALVALALSRVRRLRPWVAFFALVTLAQPPLVFLSRLVPYQDLTVPGYVVALFAAGAGLAGLALLVERALQPRLGGRGENLVAPVALVSVGLAVLLVDVVLGSPLQINTVFGYSPTVAGRFAGWGNLAFALVAASSVVVATGLWAILSGDQRRRGPLLVALLLLVVVLADGLPMLGADVGGVLALLPGAAVVVLLLSKRRVSARVTALIAGATVVAIALFAAVDLARPADQRTHLGRLADKVVHAQGGDIGTVLTRKLHANVSILTSSVWTWILPVAIALLAFLTVRRSSLLRALEERVPGLRACLVGTLVTGVLGFALNDSGVAVPAMMLAVVLPYVTYVLARTAET